MQRVRRSDLKPKKAQSKKALLEQAGRVAEAARRRVEAERIREVANRKLRDYH